MQNGKCITSFAQSGRLIWAWFLSEYYETLESSRLTIIDSFGAPCAFAIPGLGLWQQGHQESGFTSAGVDANGFGTPVGLCCAMRHGSVCFAALLSGLNIKPK